jgi:hypothetical protein
MSQEIEKCPYCGQPMENGYVAGARGIHWRNKEWGLPYIAIDQGELLGPHASMWQWRMPHVQANRCQKCRIVLIRYGKEKCVH